MKRTFLTICAAASIFAAMLLAASCQEKEPSYGLTSVSLVTTAGQSYDFAIDQTALTVTNTSDPIPTLTQDVELKTATLKVASTLETTISVNGTAVTSGEATVDATGAITITVQYSEKWMKTYTVTVVKAEVSSDLSKGVKVTGDIRAGGIPSDVTGYDVVYMNGRFYMYASEYDGTNAKYTVFSSTNCTQWTSTGASSVGAVGSRAVVLGSKSYLMGGCRYWGKDEDGKDPELSGSGWGLNCLDTVLRSYSTADFASFANNTANQTFATTDGTAPVFPKRFVKSNSSHYNMVTTFNDKIYWKGGLSFSFGMLQFSENHMLSSADGISWTEITPAESASNVTRLPAFYSFKGKLWMVGGFKSFISAANLLNTIKSTTDATTWTTETDTLATKMMGPTIVVNKSGTTAYMFGGLYNNGTDFVASNKVYKSSDGLKWTEVEVNSDYAGGVMPAVVVDDNNIAWVFPRYATKLGNYFYSITADDVKGNLKYDVWAFALDK